ncbi:hypothetical protein ZWY2020_025854 [Hordeum vulgare]|nr:hypothetical protein ZWY2020_025854 [Hordeum vulgare]
MRHFGARTVTPWRRSPGQAERRGSARGCCWRGPTALAPVEEKVEALDAGEQRDEAQGPAGAVANDDATEYARAWPLGWSCTSATGWSLEVTLRPTTEPGRDDEVRLGRTGEGMRGAVAPSGPPVPRQGEPTGRPR